MIIFDTVIVFIVHIENKSWVRNMEECWEIKREKAYGWIVRLITKYKLL